ncbi:hypothetical protein BH10ACI1_BH10ACI1_20660 [soil metagenome]
MSKTSFSYLATIKYHDKFEIVGEKFENVNVVSLELSWAQYCGSLCAMGFSREKIIVFDKNNEPVAMFADIDGSVWVS